MLEQLKKTLRDIVADDEIFDLVAQACRKNYSALVKAGFTGDQAMDIVVRQGTGIHGS